MSCPAVSLTTPIPMRALLILLATVVTVAADTTILLDPFTFPSSPGATNTDVNSNAATRQSGTDPTAYTEFSQGVAGNDALLENSTLIGSEVLLLRTIHGAVTSQAGVRADVNFGSKLAGKKWTVSYTGRISRADVNIFDAWLSFSVGDQAVLTGPTGATTDFGFLVRGNGGWQAWTDGSVPANGNGDSGALRNPDLWGVSFTVTITVDETLSQPTAQATVVVGTSTFSLGPWNVGFETATERFFELRAHNGGNGSSAGALYSTAESDSLTVTQINTLPQPPLISSTPLAQSLWVGDPLALSVTASGTAPITYEWRLNGTPIPGATSPTYTSRECARHDGGTYTVAVTNPFGTATSTAAVSVIFPTPALATWEPAGPSNRRTGLTISEIQYHPETRSDASGLGVPGTLQLQPVGGGTWRLPPQR